MKRLSYLYLFCSLLSVATVVAQAPDLIEAEEDEVHLDRKPIPPIDFSLPFPTPETTKKVGRSGKKGFSTPERGFVVPPVFSRLPKLYDSTGMLAAKGRAYGIIDGYGRTLVPFEYGSGLRLLNADNSPSNIIALRKGNYQTVNYSFFKNSGERLEQFSSIGRIKNVSRLSEALYEIELFDDSAKPFNYYYYFIDEQRFLSNQPARKISSAYTKGIFVLNTKDTGAYVFNAAGEPLAFDNYQEVRPYLVEKGTSFTPVYAASSDQGTGLIDAAGDTLLSFTYRRINNDVYLPNSQHALIITDSTEMIGLYDAKRQQWIAEPQYQQVARYNRNRFLTAVDENGYQTAYQLNGERIPIEPMLGLEQVSVYTISARNAQGQEQIFNYKGELMSPEYFSSVRRLSQRFVSVTSWEQGQEIWQRIKDGGDRQAPENQPLKALLDLETGKLLTEYRYTKISAQRRGQNFKISAERDGMRGSLNLDGSERNDFTQQ